MSDPAGATHQPWLLKLLEELLDLPALDSHQTLNAASGRVAYWLQCDKVDAFVIDHARSSLVAVGTSDTPLGSRQRALGLDVLPLANGGSVVQVYQTRRSYLTGDASLDEAELRGIVHELGVRSSMSVLLEIAGEPRGVLAVVAQAAHRFNEEDLRGLELIARWVGALAHRAELVDHLRREEALRARQRAAEEIIAVLAHDLRNHLNPLSARLQALKLRLASGGAIEVSDVDTALKAVRRLTRLTQDLLEGARLEHGLFELELGPVDLAALARDAAQALAAPGKEVQVTAPAALWLIADGVRLQQALENVVANGVRHSPTGRPLQLKVSCPDDRRHAIVEVIDQGQGVPPELLPHLFERFVSTGGRRGMGLGLFLAERIVRAHGGSLQVESRPGEGARFWFDLPLEAEPAPL